MARQLAASASSGAVLVDARLREGRAILAAPGNQSAARPIILDNAEQSDAASLLSWVSTVDGLDSRNGSNLRLPRFVLVGGPFGMPEPPGDRSDGRIARIQMGPLSLFEAGRASMRRLWLRGGYPEAFGAASDEAAFAWLETYMADLSHGTLAAWGLPREPALIASLLEAVAGQNGRPFNENAAARALGVSRPTISRYLGLLEKAEILFRIPALSPGAVPVGSVPGSKLPGANRAIKSPVLYIRDSGLLHAILGVRSADELALKPQMAAASWTGFVAAQLREALPPGASLYRYASADGAVLELVLVRDGTPFITAAARRLRPASVERSVSYAAKTASGADASRYIIVPDGGERCLPAGFIVLGLGSFLERLTGA
ncbi:MAG: hypothetical protein A2Y38_03890 [Spirochaetes bacterium GWB1_59_5]|nr:MAG: hypothetical protein A2Y38_03890 [Spirochaetes bacterium GWB1_59_5]